MEAEIAVGEEGEVHPGEAVGVDPEVGDANLFIRQVSANVCIRMNVMGSYKGRDSEY